MPHEEQRRNADRILRERGVSCALFAEPANVTWLTGHAPPLQVGATPFLGNPAYVWYRDGHFTCLVQDAHARALEDLDGSADASVVPYVGYTLDRPITIADNLVRAFEDVLADGPPRGRVGVERDSAPSRLARLLDGRTRESVDIDGWLSPLRMVKTDEELVKLRENFDLIAVGHAAARERAVPGAREIDVWTAVQSAVERRAGRRVPLGNDCVIGRREGNVGGWPEAYRLREHDSLIVDLSTGLHGYWSDSCATYFAGGPDERQREIHEVVTQALELAISLVRPGVRANEVDATLRRFIEEAGYEPFPHHGGHGVGTSMHEAPRLTPYDDTPLEAGMVIMLEPGIYLPGDTGVRLEDGVLVTPDGAERLTNHDTSAR